MRENLAELWRFRYLLKMLVARDLTVRYKNSVLGFFWSIVPPLLQVIVYSFVIKDVLNKGAPNYSAYLLCGLIPWIFFSTAILDASQSILVNTPIIRKAYMPREVIPLYYVISNFIHFLLGWAVYAAAFFLLLRPFGKGVPIQPTLLWFPVITLAEFLLVAGCSLWVSALNVFYEDVKYIVQTLFNLFFFLFPILYPADLVAYSSVMRAHPWLFTLYMLNPITAIIDAYRKTLLDPLPLAYLNPPDRLRNLHDPTLHQPLPMQWSTFAGACLIALLIAWSGYWYFNRWKWQFVERV
jgi:ABC-type polysaccharide/polyol phosphate export permease